ncbi:hypothetical protein [Hyphomicrobium sp. 2TAF46]|uniref:hypothetical protein n=1 Tax=Hyphomicrobium sp. 2TAF46 TaxID=3233019 RepID=UPI003F926020
MPVGYGLGAGADDPVEFDVVSERLFRSSVAGDGLFPPADNLLPVTGWDASPGPRMFAKETAAADASMLDCVIDGWKYDAQSRV